MNGRLGCSCRLVSPRAVAFRHRFVHGAKRQVGRLARWARRGGACAVSVYVGVSGVRVYTPDPPLREPDIKRWGPPRRQMLQKDLITDPDASLAA